MGSTLYWKPIEKHKGSFSDDLKFALMHKYSCGAAITQIELSNDDKGLHEYLEGLFYGADRNLKNEINKLREILKKHTTILLIEEC